MTIIEKYTLFTSKKTIRPSLTNTKLLFLEKKLDFNNKPKKAVCLNFVLVLHSDKSFIGIKSHLTACQKTQHFCPCICNIMLMTGISL